MPASSPAGPPVLGLRLGADAHVDNQGWLVRDLTVPVGLDGPPGILQGGLAAGVAAPVARLVDRFKAPLTRLRTRLHAPTPLGSTVQARVRAGDGPAHYLVETHHDGRLLTSAEVELAGHDPAPLGLDLLALATVRLPEPQPQHAYPTCFVCGPEPHHTHGLRLHPRFGASGTIVQPWIPAEELGVDRGVAPLIVSAVLDCPTLWVAMGRIRDAGAIGAMLADLEVQHYRDVPVEEPVRVVARFDTIDGRKVRSRAAIVDEEGTCYALASALNITVDRLPTGDLSPR